MAEKKGIYPNGDYPFAPSAPHPSNQAHGMPTYIPDRPPPPSYDESQKSQFASAPAASFASAPTAPYPHVVAAATMSPSYPQMNQGYVHAPMQAQPPYAPMAQPQYAPQAVPRNVPQNHTVQAQPSNKSVHVLQFAPGARFNGKGGASVSVPPPPPGVAPTPAQLAAMQGQPVILQKKKNSFF